MSESETRQVKMSSYYDALQTIMRGIAYVPRECRYNQLEMIIKDFKPSGISEAKWRSDCDNELIHSWVRHDPAIAGALEKEIFSDEAREMRAYLASLRYATRNGLWREPYSSMLQFEEPEAKRPEE